MAVHPLDEYGLPVDQQLGIADLHLPESHLQGYDFERLAGRIFQSGRQCVERRSFGRPAPGTGHFQGHVDVGAFLLALVDSLLRRGNSFSLGVFQRQLHLDTGHALIMQKDIQPAVLIVVDQIGSDAYIFDNLLIRCVQIAIAGYAAEMEEILVFEIAAV